MCLTHIRPSDLVRFRFNLCNFLINLDIFVGLLGGVIGPPQGLYLHTGQHKTEKRRHISMPRMGFEPRIQVIQMSKTVFRVWHLFCMQQQALGVVLASYLASDHWMRYLYTQSVKKQATGWLEFNSSQRQCFSSTDEHQVPIPRGTKAWRSPLSLTRCSMCGVLPSHTPYASVVWC
jgi:hypothetical protein